MVEAKLGDYILSKDNEVYRVTNVDTYDTHVTYTIKSLKSTVEFVESYSYAYYREIKGLSRKHLRNLGTIIPEEHATKTLELLYSNKDT